MDKFKATFNDYYYRNLAIFISLKYFASTIANMAITLLVLKNSSLTYAALVAAAMVLSNVLLAPFSGSLSDRGEAKKLIKYSAIIEIIIYVILGFMIGSINNVTISLLAFLSFILGLIASVQNPSISVFIRGGSEGSIKDKVSTIRSLRNLSLVLGPGVGASLTSSLNHNLVLLFPSFIIATALLFIQKIDVNHKKHDKKVGILKDLLNAGKIFLKIKWLPWFALHGTLVGGLWLASFRIVAADYFISRVSNPSIWGWMVGVFNIGLIIGSVLTVKVQFSKEIFWAFFSSFGIGAPLLCMTFDGVPLITLLFLFLLSGIMFELLIFYGQTVVLDGVPKTNVGRISSLLSICENFGIFSGYLILLIPGISSNKEEFLYFSPLLISFISLIFPIILIFVFRKTFGNYNKGWKTEDWKNYYS
ncbi:MAG: MFS transporter [Rothia sp. (in: high G+C Gram-positive bacteria)]|nr:MFS transporter [Rothia sp. (in: high G+C Gram-positive bacteria)]